PPNLPSFPTRRSSDLQALQLERLPAPVLSASGMLGEGDVYGAERILRQFLLKHGNHLEAMRLLAQIGVQLDVLDDAEFLLESVRSEEHTSELQSLRHL